MPEELRVLDGALLFSAWDADKGRELWASDGTEASTKRFQDLALGSKSSSPSQFIIAGPNIYFYATDAVHGFELWRLPRSALFERGLSSLYFHTLPPCRLEDTRAGPPLALGKPAAIPVRLRCGIPASARAIAANFTVVGPTAAGELLVSPGTDFQPATVVAFGAGQTRAGNAVMLAADGSGEILVGASADLTTHLLIDVVGYFE